MLEQNLDYYIDYFTDTCPYCGYRLTDYTGAECPECGTNLEI